jgi:selenocysteine lyase/cysteine desulfurase
VKRGGQTLGEEGTAAFEAGTSAIAERARLGAVVDHLGAVGLDEVRDWE